MLGTIRTAVLAGLMMAVAGVAAAKITTLAGDKVEAGQTYDDLLLTAGESVTLNMASSDDVFAAGSEVQSQGASADHLFVAAGQAIFSGTSIRDLIAMGGTLMLESGQSADDVVLAGGRINLGSGFITTGSALLAGGEVDVAGPVGGDLFIGGGEIRIDGPVGGDVRVGGGRLIVGPNARIAGDLAYRADQVVIDPQAVIQGQRIELPADTRWDKDDAPSAGEAAGMGVVWAVLMALGGAVAVTVLSALLPRLMDEAAGAVTARPLPALGVGFLAFIAAPFLIILLMVTLIGIPLGLIAGALFLAALALSVSTVAWAVAGLLRGRVGKRSGPVGGFGRFVWSLAAFALIGLLGAIPFVGWLLWIVVYVIGMGGVLIGARTALSRSDAAVAT